jgi:hypothetical protein
VGGGLGDSHQLSSLDGDGDGNNSSQQLVTATTAANNCSTIAFGDAHHSLHLMVMVRLRDSFCVQTIRLRCPICTDITH